jgi:E-phenylitaconyl-CoA hydratase
MSDHEFENIRYEKQGHIAILTINRPERLNAIDVNTSSEMLEAWEDFRDDPDLRVAVLTGAGDRAFSTGNDLVAQSQGRMTPRGRRASFGGFTKRLDLFKPVVAAINGYCLAGGMELALASDIRICVPEARFGLPEVRWSLIPAAGGTQRLPRAVPPAWANYMILTAEQIDAETALQIGLVTHIVPREELMDRALGIAKTIASRGPLAIKAAKESMIRGQSMPLDQGLAFEDHIAAPVFRSEDAKEGPRAFAEKREPNFQGR